MSFVELRTHSAFSFGDGSVPPDRLVAYAAHLGYHTLGLTDTADLGGVVRFVEEARRQGIKPIVGAELVVDGYPAAFLVRSEEGFHNLAALVTRSRVGSLYEWRKEDVPRTRGRPQLTWNQVAARSDGLFALTGPAAGEVASLIRSQRRDEALYRISRWREIFGEHLAIEVHLHHAGGEESALAAELIELAHRAGVPWLVAQDPRYIDDDTRLTHDILTALRVGCTLDEAMQRGILHPNGEWRLRDPHEVATRWNGREEGIAQTEIVAEQCDFSLRWMRPPLPRFPQCPGLNDDDYLHYQVYEGARERWGKLTPQQEQQLEHELGVIHRLGFAGFFLVMWDAVRFARHQGILCQGRGSAANSAVAYCLEITAVDPIANGLLFERFLSEIRVDGQTEAPDIDVDIEHDRREEVLEYVYNRYERHHSAITCTILTYHAPSAVQDAMRALGYPAATALEISKRTHRFDPAEGAVQVSGGLGQRFGVDLESARGRALLRAVRAFDGVPRMRSTHVGGFVLSSAALGNYLPIEPTTMGRTIIQFDKDDLDAVGIPKFDFLGLGALSMVRRAFDCIELRTGERPQMYRLPVDDSATYDLIATGETVGMFQIESRAQIASILHTRPDRLYDLVVQVALIRPGPIQAKFVHPYTVRRRGLEKVQYLDPRLEPILKRTYGIPIFQEQAMAIAMALGGFSAAEADQLRRTMGNIRKKGRLEEVLEKLRLRMIENGVKSEISARITEDLISFANYGFPESHAWSFALIGYATAYLKAHHPAEFFVGLLNSWPMGFYPTSTLVHDARRHGVKVLPPCMSVGDWECTMIACPTCDRVAPAGEAFLEGSQSVATAATAQRLLPPCGRLLRNDSPAVAPTFRIGWRHIRGLGEKTLDRIRLAHATGAFTSIEDVVRRCGLERAEALAIARSGAMAVWEPDRRKAAWEALRVCGDSLPLAPAHTRRYTPRPMTPWETVVMDYFALGLSTNGHPVEHLRPKFAAMGVKGSRDFPRLRNGELIRVAGLVTVRQRPESAGGTIFLLMEDEHGFMNIIVPYQLVERFSDPVKFASFLLVEGRFERDGGVMNVVGERFRALNVKGLVHQSHDFH
jgi:error-prone DNA polymerase